MTNLRLEERSGALEKDHDVFISTKYTAQNVLTHTMETYIDSGKYKNWIVKVKKLIEDSYEKKSDYYSDFNTVNSRQPSNYNTLIRSYKPLFDVTGGDLAYSAISTSTP